MVIFIFSIFVAIKYNLNFMYRRVFTPSIHSPNFSFQIPEDWYGKEVEVVAFPIMPEAKKSKKTLGDLWGIIDKDTHEKLTDSTKPREERKKVSLTAGFNIWGKDDPAVSD